jgi:ABC-type oligopeptide transport system substrate-binding subunit
MRCLLLCLLLAGAQDESLLRVSWGVPRELDPHRAQTFAEARYVAALFEGLTAIGADGASAAPGVAERWEESADGLAWTFHLREARWSDGSPLTAADFVSSWRRALRVETGCAFAPLFRRIRNVGPYLDGLEADAILAQYEDLKPVQPNLVRVRLAACASKRHVEGLKKRGEDEAAAEAAKRADVAEAELGFSAPDPRTLLVRVEERTPWLPVTLAFMAFVPVPERAIAAHGAEWVKPGRLVGNGPYLYAASALSTLTLRRNPRYWDPRGPARIDVGLHSPELAVEKFKEGGLDWVSREQIPDGAAPDGLVKGSGWSTFFLRLNCSKPPFDKPALRLAIAKALDRAPVAEAARAPAATSLVPRGFPGYPEVSAPARDPAGAMEALLKETGTAGPPRLEILATDAFRLGEAAAALRDQLEKSLGLVVRVRTMRFPAYREALATGEFQLAMGAWMGDAFDPLTFLEGWTATHPENAFGAADAGFDRLLAAAAADPAARLATLAKAEERLLAGAAVIPLFAGADLALVGPRLEGFRFGLAGPFPLKELRVRR